MVNAAVLQHPFNRGSIHIASADPLAYPAIDPKHLTYEFGEEFCLRSALYRKTDSWYIEDKQVAIDAVKFITKLSQTGKLNCTLSR